MNSMGVPMHKLQTLLAISITLLITAALAAPVAAAPTTGTQQTTTPHMPLSCQVLFVFLRHHMLNGGAPQMPHVDWGGPGAPGVPDGTINIVDLQIFAHHVFTDLDQGDAWCQEQLEWQENACYVAGE